MKPKAWNPDIILARADKRWVSRKILDEVVIMPLCSGSQNESCRLIYSFSNRTAVVLWEMIDSKTTIGEILRAFTERFAGEAKTIEAEITESINDLLSAGLVVKAGTRKSHSVQQLDVTRARPRKYSTPEIAAVRMQPEQAVLSCCDHYADPKSHQIIAGDYVNACNYTPAQASYDEKCAVLPCANANNRHTITGVSS